MLIDDHFQFSSAVVQMPHPKVGAARIVVWLFFPSRLCKKLPWTLLEPW